MPARDPDRQPGRADAEGADSPAKNDSPVEAARRIADRMRTLDPADEASARRFAVDILARLAELADAVPRLLDAAGRDPVGASLDRLTGLMEALRRTEIPAEGWDPLLGLPREGRPVHTAGRALLEFRRLGAALIHAHEALTTDRDRLREERHQLEAHCRACDGCQEELDGALAAGEAVRTTAAGEFGAALDRRLFELRHQHALLVHRRALLMAAANNLDELIRRVDETQAATMPLLQTQLVAAVGLLRSLAATTPGRPAGRVRLDKQLDRLSADAALCDGIRAIQRLFAGVCGLIDRTVRSE
ncbi:MAG: hypothetical protein GX414_09500 [Acidobacteria bacterium]|nr:hypothetical protein [Acidobacteriota bacterium]